MYKVWAHELNFKVQFGPNSEINLQVQTCLRNKLTQYYVVAPEDWLLTMPVLYLLTNLTVVSGHQSKMKMCFSLYLKSDIQCMIGLL